MQHVSHVTSYRNETIECTCGVIVTAEPDRVIPDRHEPLILAWKGHLASVVAERKPRPVAEGGWQGIKGRGITITSKAMKRALDEGTTIG